MAVFHSAASASSGKASSPIDASASAAEGETSRDLTADNMDAQEVTGVCGSATTPMQRSASCGISTGSGDHLPKTPSQEKLQALKQRKIDLEKLLNEKNIILDQLQRQEQQIVSGDYIFDTSFLKTNSLNLRKKISTTSFKLPGNSKGKCPTKERSGSVGDMEKKLRQEIIASQTHNLPGAGNTRVKSTISVSHADYEPVTLSIAQQKLLSKRQLHQDAESVGLAAHPIQAMDLPATAYQPNFARNPNLPVVIDINRNPGAKLMSHSPVPALSGQSHRCSPVLMAGGSHSSKYTVRVNPNNNYCMAERRNSIKSMMQHKGTPSPKLHRQDDRVSTGANSSSGILDYKDAVHVSNKGNRIDYDIVGNAMIVSPQQLHANNNNNGLLYDADGSVYLANSFIGGFVPDSGDAMAQLVGHPGDIPLSGNIMTSMSAPGGPLMNNTGKMLNPDPNLVLRYSKQPDYDETPYCHQRSSTLSGRKSAQLHMDVAPTKPIFNAPKSVVDNHVPVVGLGGFWKTLGNERIWCTVDTSYDSSSVKQNHRPKKFNAATKATPIKSISLGNFDMINDAGSREELVDRISISSMNSDGNKKPKEKQWLETSLDGPSVVTTRHSNQPIGALIPGQHTHAHQMDIHVPIGGTTGMVEQQASPQPSPTHRLKLSAKHIPNGLSYNNSCKLDGSPKQQPRKASNKPSRSTSYCADFYAHHPGQTYHPQSAPLATSPPQSTHEYTTPSTALDATSFTLAKQRPPPPVFSSTIQSSQCPLKSAHNPQPPKERNLQKSPSLSYPLSPSPVAAKNPPSVNPRSPINAIAFHHDLIRIESPKNMTVVQQAVFLPYKEVTKPFEMSDFYKYSTKFRQKDKQPAPPAQPKQGFLQQQVEVEQ